MSNPSIRIHRTLSSERSLLSIPPIFFISLSFALGIWFAYLVPFSFTLVAIVAFTGVAVLSFLTKHEQFGRISIFIFFLAGMLFGANDQILPDLDISILAAEGPVTLEGNVVTVPETTVKGRKETVSFTVAGRNFFRKGNSNPVNVTGKVQVFLHNPGREIHFGDRLRLRGMLEIPEKPRNPHSFDYAGYLAKSGIRRVLRGVGRYSVLRQQPEEGSLILSKLSQFRVFLKGRMERLFPSPYHELASALVLGFRKNIPRPIQDAFIKTGTAHLLAISGLNISLVAGLFYFLNQFAGLGRTFNLFLTCIFIAFYTVLAGANYPVLRAGIMGTVIAAGLLFGEPRNLKSAFLFALFVLLAFKPSAFFNVSFQLSFIAMASLIFILPRLEQMFLARVMEEAVVWHGRWRVILAQVRRSLLQTLLASIAATVGMLPFLAFYFNLFSWIGFLANIFVVPICTASIASTLALLVMDLICPPFTEWIRFVPLAIFKLELGLVRFFAGIPAGYFYVSSPPWPAFLLYYGFLLAWLFLPARFVQSWVRTSCLVGVGIVSVVFSTAWKPLTPEITFFDLGRSSHAAHFRCSDGANLLINTGRHFPSDQGYWVFRPFFMASQIQKLDAIFITKLDGSLAGGFGTLRNHVKFWKLWIPSGDYDTDRWSKYIGLNRNGNSRIGIVSAGDSFQIGSDRKNRVEILASSSGQVLAFKIQDGDNRILYLVSSKPEVFERLIELREFNFDVLFIPNQKFAISASQERFLKRILTRFIVSNQREFLSEFRMRLKIISNADLLFLEDMGAISLNFSRGEVKLKR